MVHVGGIVSRSGFDFTWSLLYVAVPELYGCQCLDCNRPRPCFAANKYLSHLLNHKKTTQVFGNCSSPRSIGIERVAEAEKSSEGMGLPDRHSVYLRLRSRAVELLDDIAQYPSTPRNLLYTCILIVYKVRPCNKQIYPLVHSRSGSALLHPQPSPLATSCLPFPTANVCLPSKCILSEPATFQYAHSQNLSLS